MHSTLSKMGISDLKRYLNNATKDEIILDILKLFKENKNVQEYYRLKFEPASDDIIKKYKKIIQNEFFPDRGMGKFRLSVARNAISDYKKSGGPPGGTIELMLYYVENCIDFTDKYGDMDGNFYNSTVNMYERAARFAVKNNLLEGCRESFEKILGMVMKISIGWGFQENIEEVYYEYFE